VFVLDFVGLGCIIRNMKYLNVHFKTQSSRNDYLIIPHLSLEELPVFPPESSRDTDLKQKIGIHVAYVSNIGINCAHF
jgi:hypothetical protein